MKNKHAYENTEFGPACFGCGIMKHIDDKDPCTEDYVAKKISDIKQEIEKLNIFLKVILERYPSFNTEQEVPTQ